MKSSFIGKLQIVLILFCGFNLSAQNVLVDSKIKVDATKMKINESNHEYYAYSTYDTKKSDSLIVTIGTVGTSVTTVRINLEEIYPRAFISLWSDYPEYNEKNTLDVEFEYYELKLNNTKFNIGDRIMGTIKGVSKPIINSSGEYRLEFEGDFSHIIGKLMIKKKENPKYTILDNH